MKSNFKLKTTNDGKANGDWDFNGFRLRERIENTTMGDRKSILCIVPLPPPITGAAIASETIVNYLKQHHSVVVIPYQRGNLISERFSLKQLFKIIAIGMRLILLRLERKCFDSVYLVISSTFWGNMRDIFFFIILGSRLRKETVLHLHGANIDKYLNTTSFLVKFFNRSLLSEVKNGIVLGKTFKNIFDGYIPNNRIKIVENYFDPSLLISEEKLLRKFNSIEKVNILFLGNLIKEKGYELLLDVFLSLPHDISNKAVLHFAGEMYSSKKNASFFEKIKNRTNIFYHGPVTGEKKQYLLWNTHISCLPSFYKYEGQPISILESYASGCILIVTNTGGIKEIFVNEKNGFFIDIDIDKFRKTLEMVISNIDKYKNTAYFNRKEAITKYTEEMYCKNIEKILLVENVPKR